MVLGREDVFSGQIRKVIEQLLGRHSPGQVRQHVIDCDPHAADARFTAHHRRVERDSIEIIHDGEFAVGLAFELP